MRGPVLAFDERVQGGFATGQEGGVDGGHCGLGLGSGEDSGWLISLGDMENGDEGC